MTEFVALYVQKNKYKIGYFSKENHPLWLKYYPDYRLCYVIHYEKKNLSNLLNIQDILECRSNNQKIVSIELFYKIKLPNLRLLPKKLSYLDESIFARFLEIEVPCLGYKILRRYELPNVQSYIRRAFLIGPYESPAQRSHHYLSCMHQQMSFIRNDPFSIYSNPSFMRHMLKYGIKLQRKDQISNSQLEELRRSCKEIIPPQKFHEFSKRDYEMHGQNYYVVLLYNNDYMIKCYDVNPIIKILSNMEEQYKIIGIYCYDSVNALTLPLANILFSSGNKEAIENYEKTYQVQLPNMKKYDMQKICQDNLPILHEILQNEFSQLKLKFLDYKNAIKCEEFIKEYVLYSDYIDGNYQPYFDLLPFEKLKLV